MGIIDTSIFSQFPKDTGLGAALSGFDRGLGLMSKVKDLRTQRDIKQASQGLDPTTEDGFRQLALRLYQGGHTEQALQLHKMAKDLFPSAKSTTPDYKTYDAEGGTYLYNSKDPSDVTPLQYDGQQLKPQIKPETPRKRELRVNKRGQYVSVDPDTGLDLNGRPVEAQPNVVLQQGPNGEVYTVNPRAAAAGQPGAVAPLAAPGGGKQFSTKTEEKAAFDALPKAKQIQVEDFSKSSAGYKKSAINLERVLQTGKSITNPRERVAHYLLALKRINSPENPDAVGAEEVNRLSPELRFQWMNFTNPSARLVGTDVPAFEAKLERFVNDLKANAVASDREIDKLYGRAVPKADSTTRSPSSLTKPDEEDEYQAWKKAQGY